MRSQTALNSSSLPSLTVKYGWMLQHVSWVPINPPSPLSARHSPAFKKQGPVARSYHDVPQRLTPSPAPPGDHRLCRSGGELMDHRSPHLLRKGGGVPSRPVLKRSPEQYYAVGQESRVVGVPLAQGHPHVQAQQIAAVLNSPLGLGKVLLPRPLLHHHVHILQMAKKIFRKGVQSVSNEIGESLSGHLHHDGKDQYYQHQNKVRPAQQIHYPEI